MSEQKTTQIHFTGKATEYFGIWIVNLLLSILTLGIYSAWAKVRRKKYFYNNTLIDNVGFDYHAKPVAILKGRIIAFIFFIAYAFGGQFSPFVSIFFVILFFLALPWLVVRSSIFNARNTSHRGLRFDFVGKVGEAALIFILLPIVTVFSLYLALPFMDHQRNKFMVDHHKFGLSKFAMQAKVGGFYKVYAIFIIIPLLGILAAIAIPAYMDYNKKAAKQAEVSLPYAAGFVNVKADHQILLATNAIEQEPNLVERADSDNVAPEPKATVEPKDKTFEELVEERMLERAEKREKTIEGVLEDPKKMLYVFFAFLAYALFGFGIVGYLKARLGNLVWNDATLDHLSFKSSLRARDYMWIYFTNIIVIVLTFGLATPWAQVRLARYRASKLVIVGDVDFDQFVGDKKEAVKATGEEIADFFDADFSFG
ncbi:MAG: YjgN family protein [Methylophilaceae bacterium]